MRLTELFLAQLDAEARRTRRAVEHVPEGRDDWKPHEKAMPLGRLTVLVAGMPSWLAMMIRDAELDLNQPGGSSYKSATMGKPSERLLEINDRAAQARAAQTATKDDELMK